MDETPIYSNSGKYMYWSEDDPSNRKSIYYTHTNRGGEKVAHEYDKYKIVKIARVSDGEILFEYNRYNKTKTYHGFFSIGSAAAEGAQEEWFFGGPHYLSRLYFNCDTGEVWRQHETDDETDDESKFDAFEYIWAVIHDSSPSGRYVLICGCMWSFPYTIKLYDLSRLATDGPIEIDMYDYVENRASAGDSEIHAADYEHEFVSENEIIVYMRNKDGEKHIFERIVGF